MKKSFKLNLKKILTLTLSLMFVLTCAFFATGCTFLPGDDDSGSKPPTYMGEGEYTLTIDVNGGDYPGSEGNVIVNGDEGDTYTLQTPTKDDYKFDGWVLVDGPGSFNGVTFTFGNGNAKIKATWTGGILPDLYDYLQGARFIYKPEPELLRGSDYIKKVKTQLDLMGVDIWSRLLTFYFDGTSKQVISPVKNTHNGYFVPAIDNFEEMLTKYGDLTDCFENDITNDTGKNDVINDEIIRWQGINNYNLTSLTSADISTLLANYRYHIQFLYVGVITGQYEKQTDGTYSIQNKNGSHFESDLNYILNGGPVAATGDRYDEKIENYIIYIDHTGLLDYEQEILTDLILTEIIGANLVNADNIDSKFSNNDGIAGFGAELYFNTLADSYNSLNMDISGTSDKWIATELYAQKDELFDDYGNPKFIDEDNDNMFDCWTKETFIEKGYCVEEITKAGEMLYDPQNFYYHLYVNDAGSFMYEIKIASEGIELSGVINSNTYVPNTGYEFDIRLQGFKNYENIVSLIVSNMAKATYLDKNNKEIMVYPYIPALYIQDLDTDEMTIDDELNCFNNKILTNTAGSGLSLQSVILNVKKSIFIQNLEFAVGFNSEENVKLKLNVTARYYHNGELYNFDYVGTYGEEEVVIESGSEETFVGFDFAQAATAQGIADNGLIVNPYSSKLNNYSVITDNSSNPYYRTKIASSVENFEECFNVKQNESATGSISEYADYGSDFIEILFDAEKIDGVAPSYNLCFFILDPIVKDEA